MSIDIRIICVMPVEQIIVYTYVWIEVNFFFKHSIFFFFYFYVQVKLIPAGFNHADLDWTPLINVVSAAVSVFREQQKLFVLLAVEGVDALVEDSLKEISVCQTEFVVVAVEQKNEGRKHVLENAGHSIQHVWPVKVPLVDFVVLLECLQDQVDTVEHLVAYLVHVELEA